MMNSANIFVGYKLDADKMYENKTITIEEHVCPICHREAHISNKFCSDCGHKLNNANKKEKIKTIKKQYYKVLDIDQTKFDDNEAITLDDVIYISPTTLEMCKISDNEFIIGNLISSSDECDGFIFIKPDTIDMNKLVKQITQKLNKHKIPYIKDSFGLYAGISVD